MSSMYSIANVNIQKNSIFGQLLFDRFPEAAGFLIKLLFPAKFKQSGYLTTAFPAPALHPDIIHTVQADSLHLNPLFGKPSALRTVDIVVNYYFIKMSFLLIEQHRQLKLIEHYFRESLHIT